MTTNCLSSNLKSLFCSLFLLNSLFFTTLFSQNIPDANFANAIRRNCAACIDANNNLTATATTFTNLGVGGSNINDLTGIQGFTNLTKLYCETIHLTTLPMGLTQLLLDPTKINCLPNMPTNCSIYNKNGTTDIRSSFAVCSAAHVFDTRFANALRNVCTSCLDNCDNVTATAAALTTLNVSNAGISDLRGIEGFTSLQSLYVNFNNLSSLPNNLPSGLTTLSCTNNLINHLFRQCRNECRNIEFYAVLPIELLTFKGQYISPFEGQGAGRNLLTWATAEEKNSRDFDIERSINGQVFEKIGTVKTKGSNSTYEFMDNAPLSNLGYYRLKINDLDGASKLSKIISIDNKTQQTAKIKVYPNPATSDLTIEIPLNTEGGEIVNAISQIVFKEKTTDRNELHIDINTWQSGIYFVRTTGIKALMKFIKN